MVNIKPLGKKNYGSIPHLPNSRLGIGDKHCHEGQARIATIKTRDKHDVVIVQEKLDGSNVGVARIGNELFPLIRAGYMAKDSPYEMHHYFHAWVRSNKKRFMAILKDGERICGEWLIQAHGTIYDLPHEPFVAFDIIKTNRTPYEIFYNRVSEYFVTPYTSHIGSSLSVDNALSAIGIYGKHGAVDPVEGAIWRIERHGIVDFLCKFVKQSKIDGKYLSDTPVWNRYTGNRIKSGI